MESNKTYKVYIQLYTIIGSVIPRSVIMSKLCTKVCWDEIFMYLKFRYCLFSHRRRRRDVKHVEEYNIINPTGHVMHHQFNIQQLYVLPTLYLCVLYLSENKQRLVPLTA